MATTDFAAAWGVSPKVAADMITALEKRGAYVLADGEDSRTITTGNCLYLIFNGRMFHYDASDGTTAHDGVTCCVSFDGKRFKADGFGGGLLRIFSIQSKTLTAPPVSPTIGQQWIVAVGGTGAWAGKDNYVAAWTTRGWVFSVPNTYDLAMNAADSKYYNFAVSNTWVAGLPAVVLGPSTVSPSALKYGRFGLTVVNQTTNNPPGSPSDGDAYVIGGSAGGAWAGNARNIAIWETSTWVIYPAYNGAEVFDAALANNIIYRSSTATWVANTGYAAIDITGTKSGTVSSISSGYAWSAATAPTTSNTTVLQSQSYRAKKSGAKLKITVTVDQIPFNSGGGTNVSFASAFGLFIDSTVNATDWCSGPGGGQSNTSAANITLTANYAFTYTFFATAPDTSSHIYSLAASKSGGGSMTGARIIIEELI